MKLDDFITNVLTEIDAGLGQAGIKTGRKYHVEINNNSGVRFDIAVTTANSGERQIEGTAKAGFIKVLGAEMGVKQGDKEENSQVSRIQFCVAVPSETEEERSNRNRTPDYWASNRGYNSTK